MPKTEIPTETHVDNPKGLKRGYLNTKKGWESKMLGEKP